MRLRCRYWKGNKGADLIAENSLSGAWDGKRSNGLDPGWEAKKPGKRATDLGGIRKNGNWEMMIHLSTVPESREGNLSQERRPYSF